jgi:hypothetical protein
MLTAVLIKGNPRFLKTDLAQDYYTEIVEFMEGLGVKVTIDAGADYTCPPKADFYVAHSRGCGRARCFESNPDELATFIMFGDPDGICHPKDRAWFDAGARGIPPNEHFVFTADQKLAIEQMVTQLKASAKPTEVIKPRQAASRRPGVR